MQSDVGFSQLMLAIETVPDVPNCTIVLSNAIEGVVDKRYNMLMSEEVCTPTTPIYPTNRVEA